MKKIIIITGGTVTFFTLLVQSGILDSLLIFLLVGKVPGTQYTVPSSLMLVAILCSIWLVVFRFAGVGISRGLATKRTASHQAERKKRMPKRRFGQV